MVPSLRYGIAQKNNADIQLVVDALEVAYKNELIDSFCIVSGDSDYTPLVGRLKSMGKFVLGISRSEAASNIFINACNEFQFLESVRQAQRGKAQEAESQAPANEEMADESELNKLLTTVLEEHNDEMYASELKGVLLRLRPDFNEKSYGCATFYKLLTKLAGRFGDLRVTNDNFNVMVSLTPRRGEESGGGSPADPGQLAGSLRGPAEGLQGGRLRAGQPLHPEGRHSHRLPGLQRTGHRLQALLRRDEAAGEGRAGGCGDGRAEDHADQAAVKSGGRKGLP